MVSKIKESDQFAILQSFHKIILIQFINKIKMNIEQEQFLNDTLIMAGFNPKEDDFEMLKEDMRPILNEYIELNLYKFLNDKEKAEYDKLEEKNLDFFKDRLSNFDAILAELYMNWQKEYLENFNDQLLIDN